MIFIHTFLGTRISGAPFSAGVMKFKALRGATRRRWYSAYTVFMIVFRYNGLASNAVGTSGLWSFGPAPATSTFKVENATTMVIRGKGKPATSTMPRIRDTIEQKGV